MEFTTLSLYTSYFAFLRNYGILPYKLNVRSGGGLEGGKEGIRGLGSIGYNARNFFSILHHLTFIVFSAYTTFTIFQFFKRVFSGEASRPELFALSCWLWKPIFVTVHYFYFHSRKDRICEFLTTWMETEKKIYERTAGSVLFLNYA